MRDKRFIKSGNILCKRTHRMKSTDLYGIISINLISFHLIPQHGVQLTVFHYNRISMSKIKRLGDE